MKKIVPLIYITYLLIFQVNTYASNKNYVTRYIDGKPKKCIPYYNCEPGNRILPCIEEYTKESCVPCYDNKSTSEPEFVQPDYISSHDGDLKDLECFKPLKLKNGELARCTGHDVLYSKTLVDAHCISDSGCKCNLNLCFFGDPCLCDKYHQLCAIGFHLNNDGNCVPCPEGYEKKEVGCGPCLRKENSTNQPTKPNPDPATTRVPQQTTTKRTSATRQAITLPTILVDGTVPTVANDKTTVEEDDSTAVIIIAVVVVIVTLVFLVLCCLYKYGKLESLKSVCHGTRRRQNEEGGNQIVEERAPMNQQMMLEDLNDIQQVIHNQIIVNGKPNNNNIGRNNSYSSSYKGQNSSSSNISVNRQLSSLSDERISSNDSDRLDSSTSENCPLIRMQINTHPHELNRACSVNEQELYRIKNEMNRPKIRHSDSVPQQVAHTDHGETCVSCGSPTRLPPSPISHPENEGISCIPLPDFSNIQSSSAVMNTELPNIAEFKRSLSKDSESSVDLSTSSPFSSIPEETCKDILEEVAAESNISTVTVEPPHISDVNDYNNCHLSNGTFNDVPQPSDITNQIDSRLEQYNHTMTGLDDTTDDSAHKHCHEETPICSVQRLPSEHEEETMNKKDLDSNLDSGMASTKMEGDSDLSTNSDS